MVILATSNVDAKVTYNTAVVTFNKDQNFAGAATENRVVTPFTGISNSSSIDVLYTQGSKFEVIVEGDKNMFSKLHTETKGGVLNVWIENGRYFNVKLRVKVVAPMVDNFTVTGSGSIQCSSPVKSQDGINIRVTGSGEFKAPFIAAQDVKLTVTGSGDLDIADLAADHLDSKVTGSGDIRVLNSDLGIADLMVTGSGDMSISGVADACNARVTGSGDIKGRLATENLNSKVTGSGDIRL